MRSCVLGVQVGLKGAEARGGSCRLLPAPALPSHHTHSAHSPCPFSSACAAVTRSQVREGVVKVGDGVTFGVRGVKLLMADVGAAGKLFWRAVRGACCVQQCGWEGGQAGRLAAVL